MAAGSFAPDIEIELPSGDILEMTQKEYDKYISNPNQLGELFANASPGTLQYLREEDIQSFVDWTSSAQTDEVKPVGMNTQVGQQKVDEVIGVTDTSLPPEARSFLNAIAEAEGGTYTNRFGGGPIPDPTKHPMDKVKAYGTESSAAGRYQILGGTWKGLQDKYPDITDFSPANQDKAAWRLAEEVYKIKTKGNLLEDLKAGKTDVVRSALSDTWSALRKKPLRYEQPAPDAQTPPVGASGGLEYDIQGKIRSQKLTPTLENKLTQAVGQVFGEGYKARVFSGGQKSNKPGEGTGSIRHNAGMASDVYIIGPDGNVLQDETKLDKLKAFWVENDYGSVGTYMPGGGMHLDEWTKDKLLPKMGTTWSYKKGPASG